jgi:hypothetical protein
MVRSPNGTWNPLSQRAAISEVKAHWRTINAHNVKISAKHVQAVFTAHLLPVVHGVLTSPVAADFVEFRGRAYLNKRLAPRLAPTTLGEDGKLIREFLFRNILDDQRDIEAILTDAEPTPTPTSDPASRFRPVCG